MRMRSSLIPDELLRYTHKTDHFLFHYCHRSAVAALWDPQPSPGVSSAVSLHGVPDFTYVRLFGKLFERAWDHCDVVGFMKPLGYKDDRKCDVYLYALPAGADGLTLVYPPPNNDVAILAVRNRYLDRAGSCNIQRMQASAVHEFFHAVQYAYRTTRRAGRRDPWDWWREATATFMEDVIFPGSMEHIPYLYQWFDQPHVPLDTVNGRHEYGSALFCVFLDENYGFDTIREIWEQARQVGSPLSVIDSILQSKRGISFASSHEPDAMAQFVLTNYFLTSEDYCYSYGGIYKEKFQHAFVESYCETYPFPNEAHSVGSSELDHLAARYYVFKPTADSTKLSIDLRAYLRPGEPCPLKGVLACCISGKVVCKDEVYMKPCGADGIFSANIEVSVFEPHDIGISTSQPRKLDEVLFVVINCSWGNNERNLVEYELSAKVN